MKNRDKVYKHYDEATERRGATHVLRRDAHSAVALKKPWIPEDKSVAVLDLGCGTGELLLQLRVTGFTNLTGVDSTRTQIEKARALLPDDIVLCVDDATDFLHNNQNSYELIVAYDLLEHFTKDEAVELCEAIYKALQPGGRFVVKTPNASSIFGLYGQHADLTHLTCYTEFSLFQLFDTVGLVDHHLLDKELESISLRNWRPWRPLSFGLNIRARLNVFLHRFFYWLRGQFPPRCFEFNVEVWTRKPGRE